MQNKERPPNDQNFADWIQKNAGFVEDYALQHYLKLGRGAVTVNLDSRTRKSSTAYLPANSIAEAFPDNKEMTARILGEIQRYNPDGQITYIFFADSITVSVGILQFREGFSKPLP